VVLSYSRLLWCRFSPAAGHADLFGGLEETFAAFGSVPQELLSSTR
jgi:hypothetical protein